MSESVIRSFEDLECWRACRRLRLFVASVVAPALPPDERYRLADQLLRAARSTTNNIAEGYGRYHYLDNAKFCSNARGSCWEVLDHLIDAHDGGLVGDDLLAQGRSLAGDAVRRLNGYMKYLCEVSATGTVREFPASYGAPSGVPSAGQLPEDQHPSPAVPGDD